MSKRVAIVFTIWQALGAFGFLFWNWPKDTPALWVIGFVLLLPGNFIASNIIENVLWQSPLSLQAMSVLTLITAIAVNFALWFAIGWIVRRRRTHKVDVTG